MDSRTPIERGCHRHQWQKKMLANSGVWSKADQDRFALRVFEVFAGTVELDRDGEPIPLEQLEVAA